jgi:hypothetical protein
MLPSQSSGESHTGRAVRRAELNPDVHHIMIARRILNADGRIARLFACLTTARFPADARKSRFAVSQMLVVFTSPGFTYLSGSISLR